MNTYRLIPCPLSAALILAVLFAFAYRPPAAGAQRGAPQPLTWTPCDDMADAECAFIKVPVDHARPDGATFALRLARLPALDPAQKRGVLLFIPGGPGVGVSELFSEFDRRGHHVEEFRQQYDVVTFDPRGLGQSNPIRCSPELVPTPIAPFDRAPTPAEFDAIARANAAFLRSCFEASGELMAHLSSADTAEDIERIRQALTPDAGLVAHAASYGTSFAGSYLERYGDRVQALVLDGVIDHSVDLPTNEVRTVLSVQDAFDRMARWCDQDASCALHGQDLGAAFDAAIAIAPMMRWIVPQFFAAGRDPEVGWPAIARMLAQVLAGDTATLDALTGAASIAGTAEDPGLKAGKDGLFRGVLCGDFGPQRDYAALFDAWTPLTRQAPRFAWKFWDATPFLHSTDGVGDCAGWPLDATNPPHPLQVSSHPNVVVANPTHDPPTPLINALAVWLQIPEARLLIADADGHESIGNSRCAFEAQFRFLLDPASAPPVTICPTEQPLQ